MLIQFKPRTWRVILVVFLVLMVLYFLYLVRSILVPFFWAMVLAYLLSPPVGFLERRGLPRVAGILLIYLGAAGLVVLLVGVGLPVMSGEIDELVAALPSYSQHAQDIVNNAQVEYRQAVLPQSVREAIDQGVSQIQVKIVGVLREFVQGIISLFSGVLSLIFAPILAFYIIKDADLIKKRLISALPKSWRGDVIAIAQELDRVLCSFLRGHLTVCCLVGVLTGVSMFLLGVKFSFLIGLMAGITDLVPYFGPFIGAIPAVGLALLQSPLLALYAAVVILVIQQLESNLITPKILGECVGLHPLVIVFALLAGGSLFGIVGMLLAVPGAASLKVIAKYIYLKMLNDD